MDNEVKVFFEVVDVSGGFGLPDKVVAEFKSEVAPGGDEGEHKAIDWVHNVLGKSKGKYMIRRVFRS